MARATGMRALAAVMLTTVIASAAWAEEPFLRIENGRVIWSRNVEMPVQPSWIVQVARRAPERDGSRALADDPAALELLAAHGTLRQWALVRLGEREPDPTRADSILAVATNLPGLWQFDAMRARVARAIERGDTPHAAEILGRDEPRKLNKRDRVGWNLAVARIAQRNGDLDLAWERAMRVIDRENDRWVFAADSFPEATVLVMDLEGARDTAATGEESLRLARALIRIRNYSDAENAFAAAMQSLDGEDRVTAAIERANALRRNGRTTRAREVLVNIEAKDAGQRAELLFTRARVERADKRFTQSDRLYAKAVDEARAAGADDVHADAARHRADLAWARARWTTARGYYQYSWKETRDEEARLRAGLLALRTQGGSEAYDWWAKNGASADSRFWMALGTRRANRSRADSILRIIADEPGFAYRFHQSAARETLGVQIAVESVAHASRPGEGPEWLRDADLFMEVGERDAVLRILTDVLDRGRRSRAAVGYPNARHWLRGASIAYTLGDYPTGIRMAFRARWSPKRWRDGLTTEEILPWIYPPAFDAAYRREAQKKGLDVNLFRSIGWQESFYDDDAVSRVGALGVMQFMTYTAEQVAAELGETLTSDSLLLDADRSIRYAAHYFSGLMRRYPRVPQALSAYNAGPGNANRWGRRSRGWSDAYFVEMIDFTETRGYVRNILGVRQAYRTYDPRWSDSVAAN